MPTKQIDCCRRESPDACRCHACVTLASRFRRHAFLIGLPLGRARTEPLFVLIGLVCFSYRLTPLHMLYTRSTHALHTLYTRFTHAPHTLYTRSTRALHTLHTRSTHAPRTLYTRSTHALRTLYTRSTHALHTHYTRSTHALCTLYAYSTHAQNAKK